MLNWITEILGPDDEGVHYTYEANNFRALIVDEPYEGPYIVWWTIFMLKPFHVLTTGEAPSVEEAKADAEEMFLAFATGLDVDN